MIRVSQKSHFLNGACYKAGAPKVFCFGERSWQHRRIYDVKSGRWSMFPFILDSGGCSHNTPIISDPVLRRLGLDRVIGVPNQLQVPLPLCQNVDPFVQNWDHKRQHSLIRPDDLRFNTIGSTSAVVSELINFMANSKYNNAGQILTILQNNKRFTQLSQNPSVLARAQTEIIAAKQNDWSQAINGADIIQ
jgi:hypothetical protein